MLRPMINNSPWWKRPGWTLLLIALAVGGGAWLALDRPVPESWSKRAAAPTLELPAFLRREQPDRLFCAESPDTGVCRCITAAGERPNIDTEECRRRARSSATTAPED
ncbi:MAG: hypothetical protein ACOCVP_00670 [Wenzhouxiangella sp.]